MSAAGRGDAGPVRSLLVGAALFLVVSAIGIAVVEPVYDSGPRVDIDPRVDATAVTLVHAGGEAIPATTVVVSVDCGDGDLVRFLLANATLTGGDPRFQVGDRATHPHCGTGDVLGIRVSHEPSGTVLLDAAVVRPTSTPTPAATATPASTPTPTPTAAATGTPTPTAAPTVTATEGAGRSQGPTEEPIAAFVIDREGNATTATLNATASEDPDGRIVSYEWDVDGDGEIDYTGAVVEDVAVPRGTTVTLLVVDEAGFLNTTTRTAG